MPSELANRSWLAHRPEDSDVVVASYHELVTSGFTELHGMAVITSAVTDDQLAELAARDVDLVVDTTPQPFDVTIDVATLEAMMRATVRAPGGAPERLSDDDLLEIILTAGLQPRLLQPNGPRRKSRFAFVIHPLSKRFFTKIEPLGTVMRVSPPVVTNVIEKAMAYAPPMVYSHVTGITSPTGAEAEGWLISVGGTPKEILAHEPEFTYEKLLAAAEVARGLGAQIMGLGAFTKVVGDAGVTVARKSSLPITTGNSYSASGALWAAHEAVDRLGLLERGDDGIIHGRTMVVGATGAIGSVCARLLALASDELWLVSPETAKLLALKQDIEREHPRAVVHAAATPGEHLADMDVIVTATSGAGKRVLDIMDVKPGCVITDVARPLDLSAEDVAKRPDVLVVESGEIELPGDRRADARHRPARRRRLRVPGRDGRAGPRGPLRDLHRGPGHRVGEGQGDLPAGAAARHAAGGGLRGQRRLHRRGLRPGAAARPDGTIRGSRRHGRRRHPGLSAAAQHRTGTPPWALDRWGAPGGGAPVVLAGALRARRARGAPRWGWCPAGRPGSPRTPARAPRGCS